LFSLQGGFIGEESLWASPNGLFGQDASAGGDVARGYETESHVMLVEVVDLEIVDQHGGGGVVNP
jgi:hypothetical protein